MKTTALALALGVASFVSSAHAQTILLDGFDAGTEGRFTGDATSSGSSAGMFKATSTFTLDTSIYHAGSGSQQIFIDDDSATDALANTWSWRLRHLSGGGTIANNVALANGANAYVGYYLRTTTPNMSASLILDDFDAAVNTHERGEYKPIVADGQWHLYQWSLGNANDWAGFAGTGVNGAINAATVTLDSLYIAMADDPADRDGAFWVDSISFNPTGAIPEPSSFALSLLGGIALATRIARRRAI